MVNHTWFVCIDFDCTGFECFVFFFDVVELKEGIVYFEVVVRSEVILSDARYLTNVVPECDVCLGIVIMIFWCEVEVIVVIERFMVSCLFDIGHCLFVIDNGKMLQLGEFCGGCIVYNENLGGSGGFMCGLFEACWIGLMYVLFMDDDVYVYVELIHKIVVFLCYVLFDIMVVCGAMLVVERFSIQFEVGACFKVFGYGCCCC